MGIQERAQPHLGWKCWYLVSTQVEEGMVIYLSQSMLPRLTKVSAEHQFWLRPFCANNMTMEEMSDLDKLQYKIIG